MRKKIWYGSGGQDFLRTNLSCPRSVLEDRLCRLKEGIRTYEEFVMSRC